MDMKEAAFVSRHLPTEGQMELAAQQGLRLVHVGDMDGFEGDVSLVKDYYRVVVVHAALALRMAMAGKWVGVFENANRAPEGERPTFEAVRLEWYPPGEVYRDY